MNYKDLTNIEVEGIDYNDAWDFCDAFIAYAEIDGVPLTDKELDELNENSDFVYDQVLSQLL